MTNRCQPPPGLAATGGGLTIRPLAGRIGLLLEGEADTGNRDVLRGSLIALAADGASEIHLELAGLRFIDVSCTRELIAITRRYPAARVVVHHPPESLQRITELLWPDARIEVAGCPGHTRRGAGQDAARPPTASGPLRRARP